VPAPGRVFDAIDHVLALDLGGRGIAAFFQPGAVLASARALRRARTVLIVTGFCLPPGLPETDGPPGAAVLGGALRRLGARVRYLTDPAVVPPLAAALRILGEPVEILSTSRNHEAAFALLERERPSHLVAIERPGRSRSGDYLSARGESVAAWNRPLDELFLIGGGRRRSRRSNGGYRRRPITIGVGDGGNEIGMGNARPRLLRAGARLARIACTVRVDHLVVAGTSNWGAYGIVAALEALTGKALLHTPEVERRLIAACVKAGAVDGILRRAQATVDGLPLDVHAAVVALLRAGSGRGSGMMEAE
jgi:hypothetical protein